MKTLLLIGQAFGFAFAATAVVLAATLVASLFVLSGFVAGAYLTGNAFVALAGAVTTTMAGVWLTNKVFPS
ncbi:MAG TPA: hypothetical protein V6D17_13235 [Candidatus Obscuribacterales bacterium]